MALVCFATTTTTAGWNTVDIRITMCCERALELDYGAGT
jgi:hypothetical protein